MDDNPLANGEQDNWHADSKLFNEDQTLALSTIVSGTSYYA